VISVLLFVISLWYGAYLDAQSKQFLQTFEPPTVSANI